MRRRWNRRTYKPPTQAERGTLNISPLQFRPIADILGRQQARRELWEGVAGEVKQAIERINAAGKKLNEKDDPGAPQLGPGLNIEQTLQMFSKLEAFLFKVSLDGDSLSRAVNVAHVNKMLELNEDVFIDIHRNPGRYGLSDPRQLQAIIVRESFVVAVLGRPAPKQTFMSAAPAKGKRISPTEAENIEHDRKAALFSTRIRVPEPYVVMQPMINQMFDRLGCISPSGVDQIDSSSGG